MRVDPGWRPDFTYSASSSRSGPARTSLLGVTNESRAELDTRGAQALLGQAWEAVVGSPPHAQTVAVLTAQWALETDSGRQMHGHNFAGIQATAAAAGANFHTVEGYGRTRREVTARFRVYGSAQAGARDYVRLLATRYPAALEAARAGSVGGFAQALAAGGYFTADPRAYAHGLEQRFLALQSGAPPPAASSALPALGEGALQGVLRALCRAPDDA